MEFAGWRRQTRSAGRQGNSVGREPDDSREWLEVRSVRSPVEVLDGELVELDAIEAADVHGDRIGTVPALATGERFDAAGAAEQVMDDVSVELVVGDGVFSRDQSERRRGHEVKERACAPAHRAVARMNRFLEVELDLVPDPTTMAASLM